MNVAHHQKHKHTSGFTLIELLVVIAIIGVLASAVLASLEQAREKARDATRIATVDQIAKALELYRSNNGDYMGTTSRCGNDGNGWFNADYGGPTVFSMADCLINDNVVEQELIDISGQRSGAPGGDYHAFMKINCPDGRVMIFANLESVPKANNATNGACTTATRAWDSQFGMDYIRVIE